MKCLLSFLLIIACLTGKAQLYGHWINRWPLQCVNEDTAQIWQYDFETPIRTDSIGVTWIGLSVSIPHWDTAPRHTMILEKDINTPQWTSEKTDQPGTFDFQIKTAWYNSDTIREKGVLYTKKTIIGSEKYYLLIAKITGRVYLENKNNSHSLYFKDEDAALHFYKQIKYLR